MFLKKIKIILFFLLVVSVSAQEMYYSVLDYGAKGDGQTNNTEAINSAIIDAAKNGGGTVHFPAGDYLSFTIHMQSNITIHLDQGAVLIGDKEVDGVGYDLPEDTTWYSKYQDFGHSYWKNSLIYGDSLHSIALLVME